MNSKAPLIADKQLFRLWYEFYLLALKSEDKDVQKALKKSAKFYADWHADEDLHFDDWWKRHQSLFHETNLVHITQNGDVHRDENLYVTIPRNKSYGSILDEFQIILKKEISSTRGRKMPPAHRFAPTEIQGVKRDSVALMLDLQKKVFSQSNLKGAALKERVLQFFQSDRYKRKKNEIPVVFSDDASNPGGGRLEEVNRNIRRYRQKARTLMLNVASGVFPGKY